MEKAEHPFLLPHRGFGVQPWELLGAPGRVGCHGWDVTAGVLFLGYHCWGITDGMSLLGYYFWGITVGMSLLECHFWDVTAEVSLLGCHFRGIISGMSLHTRGQEEGQKLGRMSLPCQGASPGLWARGNEQHLPRGEGSNPRTASCNSKFGH